MKIQIKSDLHLHIRRSGEIFLDSIKNAITPDPTADVLILAGDINTIQTIHAFAHEIKKFNIPVIYVPGNHEFYGASLPYMRKVFHELFKNTNVHLLDNSNVILEDICFIGATLWTPLAVTRENAQISLMIKTAFEHFSDGQSIQGLTLRAWKEEHNTSKDYIARALDKFRSLKQVVITHHLPSYRSVSHRFLGDSLNKFFVGDCEELMKEGIGPKLWIHGHTHDSKDYLINDTRIICNPYGYGPEENPSYKPNLIVEI